MTLICCVKTGDKYGPEYVTKLRNMVRWNLRGNYDFVCYTDKPVYGVECEALPSDLPGWWSKIGLFKLRQPLVYFDLDVVICGNLEPLKQWPGFGIIDDWWMPTFNSSVMKLTGEEGFVFDAFEQSVMDKLPGDQDYISQMLPHAKTFPPEWFPSFKESKCYDAPPKDALAVIFHGDPKPHQFRKGWVKDLWI